MSYLRTSSPPTNNSPDVTSYSRLIKLTRLDFALPVPPITPIVSPDLISRLMSFSTALLSLLYAKDTLLNTILPSFTVMTGFSGLRRSVCSVKTSAIRFALAWLMESMTKIIDTIIRLIRIFIQYASRLIISPVVRLPTTIILAPSHEINRIQPYTVTCISGILMTTSFSALRNML